MDEIKTPPHILLVDDEWLNIEIISEYLEVLDCIVTTANDGQQAWELLLDSHNQFDVILLDRMMPVMDGMALLALIKNNAHMKGIPVILQTARAARTEIEEGLKAGAYYYIIKPFSRTILLETVATAIRESLFFQSNIQSLKQIQCQSADKNNKDDIFEFKNLDDVREIAVKVAYQFDNPEKIVIGLVELMFNAVEHGNCDIGYTKKTELLLKGHWKNEILSRLNQDKYKNRWATLRVNRLEKKITITDQGSGFDWEQYIELDYQRMLDNHGRGIAFAKIMSFSSLQYLEGGSTVIAYIN